MGVLSVWWVLHTDRHSALIPVSTLHLNRWAQAVHVSIIQTRINFNNRDIFSQESFLFHDSTVLFVTVQLTYFQVKVFHFHFHLNSFCLTFDLSIWWILTVEDQEVLRIVSIWQGWKNMVIKKNKTLKLVGHGFISLLVI